MIDVNDLAQIVRPISFAMRVILARPARRRLAATRIAATGAKRSRPWKLADRRSGFQSMSQLRVVVARR